LRFNRFVGWLSLRGVHVGGNETQDISKNEKPYYNFWALYTAINMVLSDQGEVLEEEIEEEEKRQQIAVKLAISHLKDKDKPRWIRWYFNL
jgi:hypothetical protein